MTVLANEYVSAKQSDEFQEQITEFDPKLIVRFNTQTRVDVILREQPSIWTDRWMNEHWCQEYLPIMAVTQPDGTPIRWALTALPWLDELKRRDIRNLKKKPKEIVRDIVEHNQSLNKIKDKDYRKKQAINYGRRWSNNFCSINVGDKPWESQ